VPAVSSIWSPDSNTIGSFIILNSLSPAIVALTNLALKLLLLLSFTLIVIVDDVEAWSFAINMDFTIAVVGKVFGAVVSSPVGQVYKAVSSVDDKSTVKFLKVSAKIPLPC
jgi:hypothetical protein